MKKWWHDKIIYQIYPKSFIGNFRDGVLDFSIEKINLALEFCGFSKIYQVSKSTYPITEATALYMKNHSGPIISSSCPAVIKLIQIRFPDLIDNLLPVIPPVELAAIEAKKDNPEAGIIFVSPCPAKITASRSPLGYSKSMIDGSITASSIVVSVLGFLSKISEDFENTTFEEGNLWKQLWSNKVDYFEYQITQVGKKYPLIRESFSYYIGVVEAGICLLNNSKKLRCSVAHKRITKNEDLFEFYNPTNYILDTRVRDLSEYFKTMTLGSYNEKDYI